MSKVLRFSFLVVGLASSVSSCGGDPNVLNRAEAQKIVQSAVNLTPPFGGCPKLRDGGYEAGVAQGFWTDSWITETGQPHFASAKSDQVCLKTRPIFPVSINGIAQADKPGYQEILFSISFKDVTGPARRFIVSGYKGRAYARRFDDGWRLEEAITYDPDQSPLELTANEESAITGDIDKEQRRREEADQYAANQQASFDALAAESRTPKNPDQSFHCETNIGDAANIIDVSLNDVMIKATGKTVRRVGSMTASQAIPYGHIPDYVVDDAWLRLRQPHAGNRNALSYFYPKSCANFSSVLSAFKANYDAWWKRFDAVGAAQ